MPLADVNGASLYYESTGEGCPLVFCHEFAGDYRSWEPQVRFFSRAYRCITYNHRGYPPSSVPDTAAGFSQEWLVEDLRALSGHLGAGQAHYVGCSMGAQTVLYFALKYPELCRSITVIGAGSGSTERERWSTDIQALADGLRSRGEAAFRQYAEGPTRLPYQRKDPRGWAEFREQLAQHSATGSALTAENVMGKRTPIMARGHDLRQLHVPVLIVIGDEDEPCVDPAVFMKRHIPSAGLLVVPQTGHTVNLEEPDLLNGELLRFFNLVEAGRWTEHARAAAGFLPEVPMRP